MNKSFSGAEGVIQCARIFHGKGELKAVKSSSLLKQVVHLDKIENMALVIHHTYPRFVISITKCGLSKVRDMARNQSKKSNSQHTIYCGRQKH